MSARTHPRAVGVFVLAAVALLLAALALLSSGGWWVEKHRFAVFFPGSVRGLNPGATVSFRGVKIGEVAEVSAFLTGKPEAPFQIEVVLEIHGNIVQVPQGVTGPFHGLRGQAFADELIRRGVRARMLSASLLTGQRYIELDFQPGQPARLAGLSHGYPELPTTPTALEQLGERAEEFFEKLAELPLAKMLDDVRTVFEGLRGTLESKSLRSAFVNADRSLKELEPTLVQARASMKDMEGLIRTIQQETTSTGQAGRDSMDRLRDTLDRADKATATLDQTLRAGDDARVEAMRVLDELHQTLLVLRNLAEYVQTHPEALVIGKEAKKVDKR